MFQSVVIARDAPRDLDELPVPVDGKGGQGSASPAAEGETMRDEKAPDNVHRATGPPPR
jgi:hypothetical protein